MKVNELIKKLERYPKDSTVVVEKKVGAQNLWDGDNITGTVLGDKVVMIEIK